MSKVDSFFNLCKKQEDLINKDFYFGSTFLTTLTLVSKNSRFHSRVGLNEPHASYPVFASAWQELKSGPYTYKGKKVSDGGLKLSVSYAPPTYPELTIKANYIQVTDSPNLILQYSSQSLNLNFKSKLDSFELSATAGTEKYGFCSQIQNQYKKILPLSALLGCWLQGSNYRFILKHRIDEQNWSVGTTTLSIYQDIESLSLASFGKFCWLDKTFDLNLGLKYKIDESNSIKSKINKDKLGLVWFKYWSPKINTSLSGELDIQSYPIKCFKDSSFGFRVNFNN